MGSALGRPEEPVLSEGDIEDLVCEAGEGRLRRIGSSGTVVPPVSVAEQSA